MGSAQSVEAQSSPAACSCQDAVGKIADLPFFLAAVLGMTETALETWTLVHGVNDLGMS